MDSKNPSLSYMGTF